MEFKLHIRLNEERQEEAHFISDSQFITIQTCAGLKSKEKVENQSCRFLAGRREQISCKWSKQVGRVPASQESWQAAGVWLPTAKMAVRSSDLTLVKMAPGLVPVTCLSLVKVVPVTWCKAWRKPHGFLEQSHEFWLGAEPHKSVEPLCFNFRQNGGSYVVVLSKDGGCPHVVTLSN